MISPLTNIIPPLSKPGEEQKMAKKICLLLMIILATLASACRQDAASPQSAKSEDVVYILLDDEELGVSVEYPEGWILHDSFSGLTLASSQAVIDDTSLAGIGDESFVNIIAGELTVFGMQVGADLNSERPGEVLDVYRGLLENEGQSFAVRQPPETGTVKGQNVAQMTVESEIDGEQLVTIFSVIINGEYMAIASAGALRDHFDHVQPTLTHVLDSIVISPPSAVR